MSMVNEAWLKPCCFKEMKSLHATTATIRNCGCHFQFALIFFMVGSYGQLCCTFSKINIEAYKNKVSSF